MRRDGSGISWRETDGFTGNMEAVSFKTDPDVQLIEDLPAVAEVHHKIIDTRLRTLLESEADALVVPAVPGGHAMRVDSLTPLGRGGIQR